MKRDFLDVHVCSARILILPHKGWREGAMRTRYYGRLEGVMPEVRKMVIAAARARGVSLHKRLDDLIHAAAEAELTPSDGVEAA